MKSHSSIDQNETERLGSCFRRLLPYLDAEDTALTGSVAIDIHLSSRCLSRHRQVGDIDFVARSYECVSALATTGFLVSHFHLPQPGYPKFLVQLVDPVSRLRIDI